MEKVDVCVNYYGKPYQTAVTLKTLWNHSKQHIGTIFVVIEKIQPHNQYGSIKLLQYLLRDLPIEYYYPKYFYYTGSPPEEWLDDPDKRYGLKYQYAFETTNKKYLFLTHNDCLYKDDLLGNMLNRIDQEKQQEVMGIGLIGQCWNCPALSAGLCDGSKFETFKPTIEQAKTLIDQYKPPRAKIHNDLIASGFLHPMPECRLNEYACVVNAKVYKDLVKPKGNIPPLGGAWQGTDWGTIWFHELYNLGYKFIHYPFEPHMSHAPFSTFQSGHKGDKNSFEYFQTEELARKYLHEQLNEEIKVPFNLRITMAQYTLKNVIKYNVSTVYRKIRNRLA